jgi:predicted nucleic acid-binding protein
VKLVLKGEPYRNKARQLLRDSIVNNLTFIAPPLFESEVDTAIRRRVYDGRLNPAEGERAFQGLDKVPVQIVQHPNTRQRSRQIADQFNLRTLYDATYAALAELRGCEFWTADKVFYDAVKTGLPFVRYLPEF